MSPRGGRDEHGDALPLVLEDVGFSAGGQWFLRGVSASFEAGGAAVVLGPNGSGKSLLLRIAHGLLPPSEGRVSCGAGSAAGAGSQAMVFERPIMLRRSVRGNVEYGLVLRGWPRDRRRKRVREVLERTGLAHLEDRPARRLSAGEQQRVALARAWAFEPELLFLDEPTAALDIAASARIEALISDLVADGTKVVMTTHDLAQAKRLAGEVLFMSRGRLCERAPADRFFESPETSDARAFLKGELLS